MSARRAILVFVVLFAVVGTMVLFAALAIRGSGTSTPAAAVLVFNVPEELEEAPPPGGPGLFDFVGPDRPTVWSYADAIRRAAEDDRVHALVLHIDGLEWGWAKVAEIRDAVLAFGSSGKPVYASLSGGGEREYLLATAAGTIAAPPLALLQLNGLTASALFLRGTLDKVGVTPNFSHVGAYKSGVEPWTRTGMSPESRAALEALVDDEYRLLVDSLAAARGRDAETIVRLLDEGPYTAREALEQGLIDTLLYRPDLDSLALGGGSEGLETMTLRRYLARLTRPREGARIALITAVGTIAEGHSRGGPGQGQVLGAETLIRSLREVRDRPSIRAVVLRIDSPGGSAQASDEIWREVRRLHERKPVIVSMSDLAASGGYYIAAPADSIVAQAGTLTGSIGVFGGKLNVLGLYRKLGLNVETVSRGRHAEMLSPYRDFTDEEARLFQGQMEEVYRVFLDRVSEGRGRTVAEVDSVGQGRIWSGLAARRLGLVDALGGFERALEMARARAGIPADQALAIDVYPRVERTFLQRMVAELVGGDEEYEEASYGTALPAVVRAWLAAAAFPSGVALALMPWSVEIR